MSLALNFNASIPLSIYLHLPWCVRKCPYCDFNSHETGKNPVEDMKYIDAMIRDLDFELPRIQGRHINSIFMGGGTPSLFSPEAIEKLLVGIGSRLNLHPETEITLEANPGTSESAKFRKFNESGINRISLGIQSFSDDKLETIGRIHTSLASKQAITMAQKNGFSNINLDLMFGLPGQTVREALYDLETAINYQPAHISWYQLTIEPNTIFYSKPPVLPDDDVLWEMQESGSEMLKNSGYRHYEISAFSRDDKHCIHNLNYWQFGDYLGLGAGAHSKLTDSQGRISRYARHKLPARYMELAGCESVIIQERELSKIELPIEFMMNALRLINGFPVQLINERAGITIQEVRDKLNLAGENGLVEWNLHQIKPTNKGTRYLNELLQLFLPE